MPLVLIDSGVWFGLFDKKDSFHKEAQKRADILDAPSTQAILPWPILYEVLGTKFVKNEIALTLFERYVRKPSTRLLDDSPYRHAAYERAISIKEQKRRPLSMVDCALRLIIEDMTVKIDEFYTFNPGDFADVCRKRAIEMV